MRRMKTVHENCGESARRADSYPGNRLSRAMQQSGIGIDTIEKITKIKKGRLQFWRKGSSNPQYWVDALPVIVLLKWSKQDLEQWLTEVYGMDLATAQQRTLPDHQDM